MPKRAKSGELRADRAVGSEATRAWNQVLMRDTMGGDKNPE